MPRLSAIDGLGSQRQEPKGKWRRQASKQEESGHTPSKEKPFAVGSWMRKNQRETATLATFTLTAFVENGKGYLSRPSKVDKPGL